LIQVKGSPPDSRRPHRCGSRGTACCPCPARCRPGRARRTRNRSQSLTVGHATIDWLMCSYCAGPASRGIPRAPGTYLTFCATCDLWGRSGWAGIGAMAPAPLFFYGERRQRPHRQCDPGGLCGGPELGQCAAARVLMASMIRGIWSGSGPAVANARSPGRGTPPEPGARGLPVRPRSSYR
jgi:hypothetical protein